MKLSACIEWLFAAECPEFAQRIYAARDAGLAAVEFHLWRDKPLEAIRRALDDTGLTLSAIVVEPRCRLADPSSHPAFREAFAATLKTAELLGANYIIPSVGLALPGVAIETQRASIASAVREAVALAENSDVKLLLEPVNSRIDHPGMYLDSTREGLNVIEAVGAENLKLLFDVYHSATMGEALESLFEGRVDLLGYVQVADSPGRHEPGTGSIDWPRYGKYLKTLGYQGPIGLEYKPSEGTLKSLERTKANLNAWSDV
jgi:hydroxypyruvate isomerase